MRAFIPMASLVLLACLVPVQQVAAQEQEEDCDYCVECGFNKIKIDSDAAPPGPPGSTPVQPLREPECFEYEEGCEGLLPCEEGDNLAFTPRDVLALIDSQDWEALTTLVREHPGAFALVPEREIILIRNLGCSDAPFVALRSVPPSFGALQRVVQ